MACAPRAPLAAALARVAARAAARAPGLAAAQGPGRLLHRRAQLGKRAERACGGMAHTSWLISRHFLRGSAGSPPVSSGCEWNGRERQEAAAGRSKW